MALQNTEQDHAAAAGNLCADPDGDGCCDACGVSMCECDYCDGVGYHFPGCKFSEEDAPGTWRNPYTPSAQLRAARALIADPAAWGQGNALPPHRHCAMSALGAAGDSPSMCRAEDYLRRSLPGGRSWVARYNDDPATTHPDVLALYDRAIALAESEGQ